MSAIDALLDVATAAGVQAYMEIVCRDGDTVTIKLPDGRGVVVSGVKEKFGVLILEANQTAGIFGDVESVTSVIARGTQPEVIDAEPAWIKSLEQAAA